MNDIAFLRLMQLFDSQFPVGAYAYSGGLETYGQRGLDVAGLRMLLINQIAFGWGSLDLATMALAHQHLDNPAALEQLGEEVSAWKVIPTTRESSIRLGKRTLALAQRVFPDVANGVVFQAPHQAIVLGVLAARMGMPLRQAMGAFAQSTLTGALLAATRCMPLSPGQAQELLVELQPNLVAAVDRVLDEPSAALYAATPGLDIRAHQQAFLHTRLFQS